MEFEHDTPRALAERGGNLFFTRISDALAEVEADYDVVVIDCPPQLGFLTMSALSAATAVLVTVHPQMLDVMSMCQFLLMTSNLLGVVADAGGDMSYDWLRYLVTRYEPGDGPQNQMVSFMRSLFGDHVLNHTVLKSTAISDAGLTKQTLYEVEKADFTRATYERAMESLNAVNGEIEGLIQAGMGALDMARKNVLDRADGRPLPPSARAPPRAQTGAIGAVSRSIADLKARSVIELDPDLIDAGGLQDRLESDAGGRQRACAVDRANMASKCRCWCARIPSTRARYQIVYGRRRVLAMRALGQPVKALVRDLDDRALGAGAGAGKHRAARSVVHRKGEFRPPDARGRLRPQGDLRRAVGG